jgi:hypothetical protein
MHLIGIAGPKRGGKGTVAQAVAALYNDGTANVKDVGFADKVKIAGMKALGFDRPDKELIALADQFKIDAKIAIEYGEPDDAFGQDFHHDLTGREYLQWVGTEVGRDLFGETFWIDQVLPQPYIAENPRPGEPVDMRMNERALRDRYPGVDCLCITDVRFANEAQRILSLGGVVWEVVGRTEFTREHASEMPLPDELVTRQIENNGALIDLEVEVEAALNDLPLV